MDPHIELAKTAIENYIVNKKAIGVPNDLPSEFYEKKHGVFVSLHKGEELRGCIGTFLPSYANLAEEVIMNAIAASSRDPRFPPLAAAELPQISIEVSVLSEPQRITDRSMLDPEKYGVIVKGDEGRCGLLLPALPGVEKIEDQLSIACQKAGISPEMEKNMEIYRFEVKKFLEES